MTHLIEVHELNLIDGTNKRAMINAAKIVLIEEAPKGCWIKLAGIKQAMLVIESYKEFEEALGDVQ